MILIFALIYLAIGAFFYGYYGTKYTGAYSNTDAAPIWVFFWFFIFFIRIMKPIVFLPVNLGVHLRNSRKEKKRAKAQKVHSKNSRKNRVHLYFAHGCLFPRRQSDSDERHGTDANADQQREFYDLGNL